MRSGGGQEKRVEIVLVENDARDAAAILNTLKKANIFNKIHLLQEGGDVLEFLLRLGAFAGVGCRCVATTGS